MPRIPRKVRSTFRSEARESAEVQRLFTKVGKAIRELRHGKEYTLEQLSERAHLSAQHLLDIEHGRTNVTLASLHGIARGLGVSVSELFDGA